MPGSTRSSASHCADAVLMDLRAFSERNLGCVFELGVLVRAVALRQVLLLADGTTDMPALARILEAAWRDAPPGSANEGILQPVIRVVRIRGWTSADRELLESWLFMTLAEGTAKPQDREGTRHHPPARRAPEGS